MKNDGLMSGRVRVTETDRGVSYLDVKESATFVQNDGISWERPIHPFCSLSSRLVVRNPL